MVEPHTPEARAATMAWLTAVAAGDVESATDIVMEVGWRALTTQLTWVVMAMLEEGVEHADWSLEEKLQVLGVQFAAVDG